MPSERTSALVMPPGPRATTVESPRITPSRSMTAIFRLWIMTGWPPIVFGLL